MQCSTSTIRRAGGLAALVFAAMTAATAAHAACAVSLGSGVANSQNRAIALARQEAFGKVALASAGAPVTNLHYGEPACFFLDDGTSRIKCQVQISFCTQPPLPKPEKPLLPPHGGTGHMAGKKCFSLSAKSQGQSLNGAKAAVIKTMNQALAQRAGVALGDPRVSGKAPECSRIFGGSKNFACKMSVRFCE